MAENEILGTIKKVEGDLFNSNTLDILTRLNSSYSTDELKDLNTLKALEYKDNIKIIIGKIEEFLKENNSLAITSGFVCKEISDKLNLNFDEKVTSFSSIYGFSIETQKIFEIVL
jgi:hypothetical protein